MWKSEVGFWITIFHPIQFFSKAEERANLRFRHLFQKLLSWLILHWARLRKWQKYICVNRFLAVKSLPVENCCGMYSENARSERRLWWGLSEGRFFSLGVWRVVPPEKQKKLCIELHVGLLKESHAEYLRPRAQQRKNYFSDFGAEVTPAREIIPSGATRVKSSLRTQYRYDSTFPK